VGVFKKRNALAFVLNRVPSTRTQTGGARRVREVMELPQAAGEHRRALQAHFLRGEAHPRGVLISWVFGGKKVLGTRKMCK